MKLNIHRPAHSHDFNARVMEPTLAPSWVAPALLTVPPFEMASVPIPLTPTWSPKLWVQVELGPVTFTVPTEPVWSPTPLNASLTVRCTVLDVEHARAPLPSPTKTKPALNGTPMLVQAEFMPFTVTVPGELTPIKDGADRTHPQRAAGAVAVAAALSSWRIGA